MFGKLSIIFLLICTSLIVRIANAAPDDNGVWSQICADKYAPVCATNGKTFKKFSNSCNLQANNCRREGLPLQKYVATDMDWCTTEWVSNLNGLLEKLGGVDLNRPECITACPLIYSPVCISNGKFRLLISNECIMESLNCALAKNLTGTFRILKHDSC